MKTIHSFHFSDSRCMEGLEADRVDLLVTSPPYPMIAMWDDLFSGLNDQIGKLLDSGKGFKAFELMHRELDPVWQESFRVLKPGGIACINIGDATRSLAGSFALYPNHFRIISKMISLGFTPLPIIIWRKQTNAPNKFMGSGMLPPGAYVTLEHEYILVFRKGGLMEFAGVEAKALRRSSAFFWEERNNWYSDVWLDLKGTTQNLSNKQVRQRSAAFPFELPYRLIAMFSVKEALVLDPFWGTGTTSLAAMALGRNSVGLELDASFREIAVRAMPGLPSLANNQTERRLAKHLDFVRTRLESGYKFKHVNEPYGFPVMTAQEKGLLLNQVLEVRESTDGSFETLYSDDPQEKFRGEGLELAPS